METQSNQAQAMGTSILQLTHFPQVKRQSNGVLVAIYILHSLKIQFREVQLY